MNEPIDLAERAARALSREEQALPEAPLSDETVRAVAQAIRERRRGARRRIAVASCVAGAAAAAAVVALAATRFHRTYGPVALATSSPPAPLTESVAALVGSDARDARASRGSETRVLAAGSTVSAGDRIDVAAAGELTITVPTGTRIGLGESTSFDVVEQGNLQLFALEAGSLDAEVAKLKDGERFIVRTPDGEIEVRGTAFSLEVLPRGCDPSTTTRLDVREGVVEVRSHGMDTRVRAGGVWPPSCVAREALPIPTASIPAAIKPTAQAARSQLAEQNELYSRAVEARRRGDVDAALASFGRLVTEFPAGPLAENAAAERMKLLAHVRPAEAAAAARDYLARYPTGFARRDADAIAGGSRGRAVP